MAEFPFGDGRAGATLNLSGPACRGSHVDLKAKFRVTLKGEKFVEDSRSRVTTPRDNEFEFDEDVDTLEVVYSEETGEGFVEIKGLRRVEGHASGRKS